MRIQYKNFVSFVIVRNSTLHSIICLNLNGPTARKDLRVRLIDAIQYSPAC